MGGSHFIISYVPYTLKVQSEQLMQSINRNKSIENSSYRMNGHDFGNFSGGTAAFLKLESITLSLTASHTVPIRTVLVDRPHSK